PLSRAARLLDRLSRHSRAQLSPPLERLHAGAAWRWPLARPLRRARAPCRCPGRQGRALPARALVLGHGVDKAGVSRIGAMLTSKIETSLRPDGKTPALSCDPELAGRARPARLGAR